MWRRICSSQLKAQAIALALAQSPPCRSASVNPSILTSSPLSASRHFCVESGTYVKKRVEDVMPIATGHEQEGA